jgi:hypothetical protein
VGHLLEVLLELVLVVDIGGYYPLAFSGVGYPGGYDVLEDLRDACDAAVDCELDVSLGREKEGNLPWTRDNWAVDYTSGSSLEA